MSTRPSPARVDVGQAGEAAGVHGTHQEIAGSIACEHPAGAVGAVCRRGQPDDQHAGLRIAEAGQRPAPVVVVPERRALLFSHASAVGAQPRTAVAGDDASMKGRDRCEHVLVEAGARCCDG